MISANSEYQAFFNMIISYDYLAIQINVTGFLEKCSYLANAVPGFDPGYVAPSLAVAGVDPRFED